MSKSSSQTIGYKYFLGMHTDLWHGPIDRITRIRFDERTAWCGNNFGGRLTIDAEDLFGGEKREGGVSGEVDFLPGEPTQTVNDYLQSVLSEDPIPAFRGVAALVFRQAYLGMSPYIKQLDVRGTRIYSQTDGEEQWYPEKAAIGPCGVLYNDFANLEWEYSIGAGQLGAFADNGSVLWLAMRYSSNYSVFRSTDDGKTFEDTGNDAGAFGTKFCCYDHAANLFVIGCGDAIRSTPDGDVLTSHGRDGEIIGGGGVFAYADHWFMDTGGSTKASTDRGVTWQSVPGIGGIQHADAVVVDGWIYAKTGINQVAKSPVGSPLSWTDITPGDSGGSTYVMAFGEVAGVLYAMKGFDTHNVYRSFDKGETWEPFSLLSFGTGIVTWYAAFRNRLGVMTMDTDADGRIWIMSEDGVNWVKASGQPPTWSNIRIGEQSILVSSNSSSSETAGTKRVQYRRDDECHRQPCDMNPVHAIRECITDPAWAMGWPAARIDEDSFTAAADQCHAEGMGFSYEWQQQSPVGDLVDMICRQIDAELYIDRRTGKYTLYLIRDDYDEGGLLTLGESEILHVEDFGAPTLGELRNSVTVNFWEAESSSAASVTVHDQALAIMQGGTIGESIDHPGVSNRELATRIALRELRALASRRRTAVIYANRGARDLHPGAPFKLDYPDWTDDKPAIMRVARIAFGNGRTKVIRIECVEDVFSLGPLPIVGSMPSRWADPATRPLPAGERLVFEAPYWEIVRQVSQQQADLTLEYNELAGFLMGTARRPGIAVNAEMYADSGAGYARAATVDFSPWAILADAVAPLDTVLPLSDDEDLDEGVIGQLALLGDELVRIDAIDIESSEHTVTVGRGCLDTVPAAHDAGTALVLWQDYAAHSNTEYASGETIDVKLLPSSPSGVVSIEVATADELTFAQRAFRPYPPGQFELNGEAYPASLEIADYDDSAAISVSWAHRDRSLQTAASIDDTTAGDIGPEAGTTYTVELRDASDDSLFDSATGLTVSPADFALTGFTGTDLRVLLWAVRDAVASWQVHDWTVQVEDQPWSPAELTTLLWIDAADVSTLTINAGRVEEWRDKSGNARHFDQVVAPALRPYHGTISQNGSYVIDFDGSCLNHVSTTAFNFLHDGTKHEIFAVCKFGNAADPNALYALMGNSRAGTSGIRGCSIWYDDRASVPRNDRVVHLVSNGGTNISTRTVVDNVTADNFLPANEFCLLELAADVSNGTAANRSSMSCDFGAAAKNNTWGNAPSTANITYTTTQLGALNNNEFLLTGQIAEIVITDGLLSTADRERMQGYLAHKWGLDAKLPSDHPYKDDPPAA